MSKYPATLRLAFVILAALSFLSFGLSLVLGSNLISNLSLVMLILSTTGIGTAPQLSRLIDDVRKELARN